MRRLNGASLLEAIIAAVLFLVVFAVVMELMPRLAIRSDNAILRAEMQYRTARAFDKYASGVWPTGQYTEKYDWGNIKITITPYHDLADIQLIIIHAKAKDSKDIYTYNQLVGCN